MSLRLNIFALLLPLLLITSLIVACDQKPKPEMEQEDATEAATEPNVLPRTAAPHGARVFFISPADGETLENPIRIEFGIQGMTVVKAGDATANSGHHHLLIDTEVPNKSLPIPADKQHIHFGDGSTRTEITLSPGEHRLQLVLGDHQHIPHDPAVVSKAITITVE